jgi:hypothetical protein
MASVLDLQADSASECIIDLCEFCLEFVQWIGDPDHGGCSQIMREFEWPKQPSCKLCELLIQRLQLGTDNFSSTAETTSRIKSYCSSSLMQHEEHLLCTLKIWPHPTGALDFAVWANEGMGAIFAASFIVDGKNRDTGL